MGLLIWLLWAAGAMLVFADTSIGVLVLGGIAVLQIAVAEGAERAKNRKARFDAEGSRAARASIATQVGQAAQAEHPGPAAPARQGAQSAPAAQATQAARAAQVAPAAQVAQAAQGRPATPEDAGIASTMRQGPSASERDLLEMTVSDICDDAISRTRAYVAEIDQKLLSFKDDLTSAGLVSDEETAQKAKLRIQLWELKRECEQMWLDELVENNSSSATAGGTREDAMARRVSNTLHLKHQLRSWATLQYAAKQLFDRVSCGQHDREVFEAAYDLVKDVDGSVGYAEEKVRHYEEVWNGR